MFGIDFITFYTVLQSYMFTSEPWKVYISYNKFHDTLSNCQGTVAR